MSYSVTVTPGVCYTPHRITVNVSGLDTAVGECYDFGIILNGVTVFGYDPGGSTPAQELAGPVTVTSDPSWLSGELAAILTVRGFIFDSGGTQLDTVETTLRLIKGAYMFPYTIDDDVAALPVSGWLPRDTKRMNLYRMLLAHGVSIIKSPDGNPHFTFIRPTDVPDSIDDDDIFLSGSVEYTKPYSAVSVLEHTYTALMDASPVTLFDNTRDSSPASGTSVWFSQAPVIVETLTATAGLSIDFATENGAILTGQGVLTGIPYTHSTITVQRENAAGERGKVVTVNDDTMISSVNSDNVLNRLFGFYCPEDNIPRIRTDFVFSTQRCGQAYRFKNPFREPVTAFLASAELTASSFVRATCELYAGYTPAGQEGLYTHCIILDKRTYSEDGGVFQVPAGVTSMRVVLIGGGSGGSGGQPGENGKETYTHLNVAEDSDISGMWYGAEGGAGGSPGAGGAPGRVLSVTIEGPEASYNYTIGDGGAGGNPTLPGSTGTATTFGSFSSAGDGSYIPEAGVYDPINGKWYAIKGQPGIRGGAGGARKVESQGMYVWVTDGEDVVGPDGTVYRGGRTGSPLTRVEGLPECRFTSYGGNGAGAAVGVGSDMTDEETEELLYPAMNGGSDQTASWEVTEDG